MSVSAKFLRGGTYPSLVAGPAKMDRLIRNLRSFIGDEALQAATKSYHVQESQIDGVRALRLQERQPLIEAFELFDKQTFSGRRILKTVTPLIMDLAHVAGIGNAVIPSFTPEAAHQHRTNLLSLNGQFKPLMLEWTTAGHVIRTHNAELAWTLPGLKGPEFIGRSGGVEFEVECKRQTTMVTQILGLSEADAIAAAIIKAVRDKRFRGKLTLEVTEATAVVTTDKLRELEMELSGINVGSNEFQILGGMKLHGELVPRDGYQLLPEIWKSDSLRDMPRNARGYADADSDGYGVVDPFILYMLTPLKSLPDLKVDLWEKKFAKSAEQCTGSRGAILMFEWEDLTDPSIFAKPNLFHDLTMETFSRYKHVAKIIMRCDPEPTRRDGTVDHAVSAYAATSNVTLYPQVNEFFKFDMV